jgi:hypothetical protein
MTHFFIEKLAHIKKLYAYIQSQCEFDKIHVLDDRVCLPDSEIQVECGLIPSTAILDANGVLRVAFEGLMRKFDYFS